MSSALSSTVRDDIVSSFEIIAPNIKIQDEISLRLLGAPVLDESIPHFVEEQIDKFRQFSERLFQVNAHMAYFILKFCLFVPQFTYVLRCTHFWKFPNQLGLLDNVIKGALSEIVNCSLDGEAWVQATLPIRFGGLGVRRTSDVALPAFLSSAHASGLLFGSILNPSLGAVEVSGLTEAKSSWLLSCPGELPTLLNSQRQWDDPLCKRVQQSLLSASQSSDERARLLAVSEKESGYWLQAYPSSNIGTLLDNCAFSLSVGLRIGTKTNEPHQCQCGERVNERGHHGLSCQKSAGRISRHAAINDVIKRALVSVKVPAILEPNGIFRADGKRPDGMTLVAWKFGRTLVWDATCVDTLAPSHVDSSSSRAGAAAMSAECSKKRKYSGLGSSHLFLPFAVETMGPWGREAKLFFQDISARLIESSGDRRAGSYFAQRISLAIQRGNAASLLGTLPRCGALEDVFYL